MKNVLCSVLKAFSERHCSVTNKENVFDTLVLSFGSLTPSCSVLVLSQGECLHHKELAAVVTKLMPFLQHFCAECPGQAFTVLQKRVSLFQ